MAAFRIIAEFTTQSATDLEGARPSVRDEETAAMARFWRDLLIGGGFPVVVQIAEGDDFRPIADSELDQLADVELETFDFND